MNLLAWMRFFTIRTRMHGAIAMVLAMFSIVGLAGWLGAQRLQQLQDEMANGSAQRLAQLSQVSSTLAAGLAAQGPAAAREQALDGARQGLQRLLDTRPPAGVAAPLGEARQALGEGPGGAERAAALLAQASERMAERARAIEAEYRQTMGLLGWVFAAVVLMVLVVVVPLTLANSQSITSPISYARTVAQAVAAGDLNRKIRVEGRDETADLLASLQSMQDALRSLVGQVRESSVHIQTASVEVATGNSDLSRRTESAASSLQATAGSVEQLTGGVRQSAESADMANQLSSSAAEVARRGGEMVGRVVATMDEINQSSRRIEDIIGVIDTIAFQTNILALNAAVEAARAGEQGRGFAVVAGEVRQLAQRSATAAREIKSLISASVERVDAGARLVQDTGATMEEIVASAQRVSDIVGEIAAGTSDQSQRIAQVNGAVTQLEQMTQQNAALVEQSAAASESLREQSQRLSAAVSQFKLDQA